jgi:predicted HTH transcriptional regulator
MANAKGGMVMIGVEDATCKVVGVPDERIGETMDVILRAARQVIKPELVLDPAEPEVYVLDGKKLLVVTIPPTNGPIYQGAYLALRSSPPYELAETYLCRRRISYPSEKFMKRFSPS